ncbi:MAG: radical SAM protein [Geobacteraceae bacterium GWC2_53_11]|nr:MAG: radical SAM protein [Geobacteraceae bacterium GWC2_53_11]
MTPSELAHKLDLAGLHPPGILTLSITGACNLACCHCWVKAGETSSASHVPAETVLRLVEEFAAIGGDGIRITGGEPLSNPDWLNILQRACSLGFTTVILQTNAMLLKDTHVAALRELDFPGLTIQISLDGVLPRTHDLVRGEGAFSGALRGIELLSQVGLAPRIAIFLTEMRHNLDEIPELLDFADRMGLGSVSTGSMVLCGRASETSLVAPPRAEQYLSLLERYDHDARFREQYEKLGTVAALEWRKGDAVCRECCTFIENPYLTPTGRLYPCLMCHTDEYSVTGVFEKGLGAAFAEGVPLWSSLHRISRNRPDEIPECQDCSEKASCAGGCMGRAWGSCGNLLAADDRCQVRRAIEEAKTTTPNPSLSRRGA